MNILNDIIKYSNTDESEKQVIYINRFFKNTDR